MCICTHVHIIYLRTYLYMSRIHYLNTIDLQISRIHCGVINNVNYEIPLLNSALILSKTCDGIEINKLIVCAIIVAKNAISVDLSS